jgi:hypothetical protein
MTIQFNGNYNIRGYTLHWSDWKEVHSAKNGLHQVSESDSQYTVYFYDGPEVHIVELWKVPLPDGIVSAGYSQEQNDADLADFETNYLPTANATLMPRAASGVQGQAPAKGLGGFAPDPKNNPYEPDPDELVGLYVDGEGQAMVRGPVMTDEGSFRDDFTGTALEVELTGTVTFTQGSRLVTGSGSLFTEEVNRDHYVKLQGAGEDEWVAVVRAPTDDHLLLEEPYPGDSGTGTAIKCRWMTDQAGNTPGTVSVSSSSVTLASGTGTTGQVWISRSADYLPMVVTWRASISQRVANQSIFFGFRDDCNDPNMYCDVVLDGTDNTKVKFRSAWDGDEQLSTVSLPPGLNTSQILQYKLDLSAHTCSLLINGVLVAQHDEHVPDMYSDVHLVAGIANTGSVTNTTFNIDTVFWSNHNQIQIASIFQAPIPIITREDQHSITAKKSTTLTTANQTIISYTVPTGKVFYLIGYKIDASGSVAGVCKIGRNNLTSEPSDPGSVDDNVFRAFELPAGGTTGEVDFGGNPRKIGVGGDTILVTVTPLAALAATWRVSLDYVLR